MMFDYIISKMDEIVATRIFPSMIFNQNSIPLQKSWANKFPWHETVDVKKSYTSQYSKLYPHYVERGGP